MRHTRRTLIAATASAVLAAPFVRRGYAAEVVRLGVLSDLNGSYATLSGAGAVAAVNAAAEDFRKQHPDIPVEVLSSDFQLKPDIGLGIAREWFDTKSVDCILDVPMSALAFGLGSLAKERNKVVVFTATASDEITGKLCGPNHVHWTHDTYALGATVARAALARQLDTWFFIMPDYAMGKSQVASITHILEQNGAKVLGTVAHPFPGTTDFSSYLLRAQASGAKVICLANSGEDAVNCIKQAAEFGILGSGQAIVLPLFDTPLVKAVGLRTGHGLNYAVAAYWDQNDATRALQQRLAPVLNGGPLAQNHIGDYSGAYNYLKAVAAVGLARAKSDGRAVVEQLKSAPFDDAMFGRCVVRQDGRMVHDMRLMEIKTPSESHGDLDLARVVKTVPGDQAFRPLAEGHCPMVAG